MSLLLNRRCTRLLGCIRLRNDLYCVGWGVKLYSLSHSLPWQNVSCTCVVWWIKMKGGGREMAKLAPCDTANSLWHWVAVWHLCDIWVVPGLVGSEFFFLFSVCRVCYSVYRVIGCVDENKPAHQQPCNACSRLRSWTDARGRRTHGKEGKDMEGTGRKEMRERRGRAKGEGWREGTTPLILEHGYTVHVCLWYLYIL